MSDDDTTSDKIEGRGIICGGPVDRLSVTLALHGEDLAPDEISSLLGCSPTHSHRRGELRKSRSANVGPWKKGAWLLQLDCEAPTTASELLADLLGRVPDDETLWCSLSARWDVTIGFGLFLGGWNRSLILDAALLQRLARMKVPVDFDIYGAVDDDAHPGSSPPATPQAHRYVRGERRTSCVRRTVELEVACHVIPMSGWATALAPFRSTHFVRALQLNPRYVR